MRRRVVRRKVVRRSHVGRSELVKRKDRNVLIGVGVLVLVLVVVNFVNVPVLLEPTNQVDLFWTDNANNEDGFLLERSEDVNFNPTVSTVNTFQSIGPSNPVAATGVQITFIDDGILYPIENGITYFYRVRAFNTAGQSTDVQTSVFIPLGIVAPFILSLSPNPTSNNLASNGIITITGNDFTPTSNVEVVGLAILPNNLVTYIDSNTLVIDLSPYISGLTGSFDIQVSNGALVSNIVNLIIQDPQNPMINLVTPNLIPPSTVFDLVVSGSDFGPNTLIEVNLDFYAPVPVWNPITPTSWSPTELRVDNIDLLILGITLIPGQDVLVRVVNGGGPTSNTYTITAASACTSAQPSCLNQGVCAGTVASCNLATGTWECNYAIPPSVEVCNGLDDDCDGLIDNSLVAPLCANQLGSCVGSVQTCGGTSGWAACPVVIACMLPNSPTSFSGTPV